MRNLSKNIRKRERIDVIEKMIKSNATKEQIISYGFTVEEYKRLKLIQKIAYNRYYWQLIL